MLNRKLEKLEKVFLLSTTDILSIASNFKEEMSQGLQGTGSLKMLRTFLKAPHGRENGPFLAIDFGGTNIRVQMVELYGDGAFQIKKNIIFRLKDLEVGYDYTAQEATATELFDFITANLETLINPEHTYALGHTFSFPCRQLSVNRAILLQWTKEIQTTCVEGQEITSLLEKALAARKLYQINPMAILNDTTAILMTASYLDSRADLGSICGTGHNTCYLEPLESSTGESMIINVESGNFNRFPRTVYDMSLDRASEKTGQQQLEKAVAGHYVGEIARLAIIDLVEQGLIFQRGVPPIFRTGYSLTPQHLALLLQDQTPELQEIAEYLAHTWQLETSAQERFALQRIASMITTRSAQLVAATYAGILLHLDPELRNEHIIGVDGSMFEKMPHYVDTIHQVFEAVYQKKVDQVLIRLIKDGSGVGAAIAASTCLDK